MVVERSLIILLYRYNLVTDIIYYLPRFLAIVWAGPLGALAQCIPLSPKFKLKMKERATLISIWYRYTTHLYTDSILSKSVFNALSIKRGSIV